MSNSNLHEIIEDFQLTGKDISEIKKNIIKELKELKENS